MAFITLYRFQIELSDVDRGIYETLDFRAAQHPSESPIYLVTRVLAYALNFQDGLEFSANGLSNPDEPCIRVQTNQGGITLWIEIGNPSARKLHKASKLSNEVRVYTYKDPIHLLDEIQTEKIHKKENLKVFSFDSKFLEKLVDGLEKNNKWSLIYNDGDIILNFSTDRVEQSELKKYLWSNN